MTRRARLSAAAIVVVGLIAANRFAFAFAPTNDKAQAPDSPSERHRQHNDYSGKALLGDNIKTNGPHKLRDHGKYRASVTVWDGKVTGMSVRHADKGSVPVTKYKTTTKMRIGYGYDDEWGDEYLYWFPYDMISDGNTGAIDSYPAY